MGESGQFRWYVAAYSFAGQQNSGNALILDFYSTPGGDIYGVAAPPGQEVMVGGQTGVAGVEDPVIADGDQSPAVGDQARGGGRIGYEDPVGAVGRIQVGGTVLRNGGQSEGGGQSGGGRDRDNRAWVPLLQENGAPSGMRLTLPLPCGGTGRRR